MKEPDATPWIDRKSIVLVALTAIVTTFASEGVKTWLPSMVSYGWNAATRAKVVYVTVTYGTPTRYIADARVAIFDPEKNIVVREWSTNASGKAVLHDISGKLFLTASFAAGDKLVRAEKYIQISDYPTHTVFGKEDTWAVSDITVNATNIETPSTQNISGTPEPNDPPWLRVALAEVGVTRKLGNESNPRIVEYNASTALGPVSDKTPWGCSFVSWVFQQSQTKGNLRSARCVDWLRFGSPIADAKRGAVAIFSPIVSEATSGFVGFVLSADDKNVNLVVGNINHSVALASFPRASVRGYRWPDQ